MTRLVVWPRIIQLGFIAAGAVWIGGHAAADVAPNPDEHTIVQGGRTLTVTDTRTVKRVVKGRIIHTEQKVYVLVPQIVVHTDHHTIRIPAHKLRLRSATAAVAELPASTNVTVYVPLPPETVTTTQTIELPPVTVTTTISLPLETSGDDGYTPPTTT